MRCAGPQPTVRSRALLLCLLLLVQVSPVFAHVGTSAVFVQGNAGPYPVYVTVQPAAVIPGQAQVTVLCARDCAALGIERVAVAANVLGGDRTQMPQGIALEPGPPGSNEFLGTAWVMTQGSWQVRVEVSGTRGMGELSVPLPASPTRMLGMSGPFRLLLIVLGALLIAGLAKLASAAVTQAAVPPGETLPPSGKGERTRRGRVAGMATIAAVAALLAGFAFLWKQAIERTSRTLYQPLTMKPTVEGGRLQLRLKPPSAFEQALATRRLDDLVLDHNHKMHLYLIAWPKMERVFHLHPEQSAVGEFELALPAVPAGEYRLFADIVHADGFPETATAELPLEGFAGRPLAGDDAEGTLPPAGAAGEERMLADGFRFRFEAATPAGTPLKTIAAGTPVLLRFTLLDPAGRAPGDMQNYMGMLGHAAILKRDGMVFAHIHPDGSAAMAAMMLANQPAGNGPATMDMRMGWADGPLGNVASFPFGFPTPGAYRVLIQMKHGGTIETGAVDLDVR